MIKLNKDVKLFIVGDIHEHDKQFHNLIEIVKPSNKNILVSVGDVFDRGRGLKAANSIISSMISLSYRKSFFMVRGNHEQKRKNTNAIFSKNEQWAINRPISLSFSFSNQSKVTVMHGGVTPKHNFSDLETNTDLLYVRNIDEKGKKIPIIKKSNNGKIEYVLKKPGKSWHEYYDGRFGYIVAGHEPQKNGEVKFYKYSCNVDTACFHTGILSAVVLDENGINDVIQVKGKPERPDYY